MHIFRLHSNIIRYVSLVISTVDRLVQGIPFYDLVTLT